MIFYNTFTKNLLCAILERACEDYRRLETMGVAHEGQLVPEKIAELRAASKEGRALYIEMSGGRVPIQDIQLLLDFFKTRFFRRVCEGHYTPLDLSPDAVLQALGYTKRTPRTYPTDPHQRQARPWSPRDTE